MLRTLLSVMAVLSALATTAHAQSSIKIAILGPMAFVQGENHWAGAEMARDEINRAGGINMGGRRLTVELVKVDTNELQSVPDATNAIERAITRDRADFLMGGFRSEAVLAMQEVAMDNKKIFLGAGASLTKLGANVEANYDRYKYWFRISPTKDTDLIRTVFTILGSVAAQIRTDLKKEVPKVAILAEKAAWTEGLVPAVQKTLPAMKLEIAGLWQPSDRATDVTAELSAIERSGADIVFTLLSGPVGIVVGRQMGERNMKAVAFGINVEAQKDEFWSATAGKGQFVSTLDTFAEVELTPKMTPFVRAFKERFKKSPAYNAATYDGIYILKEAIEKTGTMNADQLVPFLEKMDFVGAAFYTTFDKRHDLVWAPGKTAGIAVQWQDGKKVPFWPPQIKGMQPFRMPR
ncbi:MAG: ABC transporter substrate-binding protein [Betaproteobacteria bacterium]|nr:ABC transporter substrate-binding protein [Betaproteobacteria bacterium]